AASPPRLPGPCRGRAPVRRCGRGGADAPWGNLQGCAWCSALRATPLGRVARAALLTNGEVQRGNALSATAADGGGGSTGGDDIARFLQQRLVVAVEGQIGAPVADDQQQARAAQPLGERHLAAVHGAHRLASGGADQRAVPGGAAVLAARGAETGDQAAYHRPGQLAARLVEGAAVVTRRVVAQPGGLVGRRLVLLLGQLPLALGFAGLARQGFLDGLENLLQLGLFALALLQAAGAVAAGPLQAGQYLLALLAHLGQARLALGQVLLLAGQDRKSTRLNSSHVKISY